MDQQSNSDRDHADEEIFTTTVSDDALEAAAGTGIGANSISPDPNFTFEPAWPCC